MVIPNKKMYGYWFPVDVNWSEFDDSIIDPAPSAQFYYYHFDSTRSRYIWSTMAYEKRIDSFTIAADDSPETLFMQDTLDHKIQYITDSTMLINNKKYIKKLNVR